MSIFICGIDTDILFSKKAYYMRFKGLECKYIPRYREGNQDDLLLKMDRRMNEEKAFLFITELLSILSFSWDAIFDTNGGFINRIPNFSWKEISCSASGRRKIQAYNKMEGFYNIYSLTNEDEIKIARLFRIAKAANDVYSQILFFWHALNYPNDNEKVTLDLIARYTEEISDTKSTIEEILKNPILLKNKIKQNNLKFSTYLHKCIRHSIAHIKRTPNAEGHSLMMDSLRELRHLHLVKNILHDFVKYRLEVDYNLKNRDYDADYLSYFEPDEDK